MIQTVAAVVAGMVVGSLVAAGSRRFRGRALSDRLAEEKRISHEEAARPAYSVMILSYLAW